MLALALSLVLATSSPTAVDLERQGASIVQREFEQVGRRAPEVDEALSRAARRLADESLRESPRGAVALLPLTEAVSDSGGADPAPRSFVIRAWSRSHVLGTLEAREDLGREPASHVGVGAAVSGERSALVVLLAERKAVLQPFPRALAKAPVSQSLCGELLRGLRQVEVFTSLPDGRVERSALTRQRGSSFCTRLVLAVEGRYTVEVVGRGERGPEVAALFLVDVGERRRGERERLVEPSSEQEARTLLLERINSLRRAYGLRTLEQEATLTRVAQEYSERMAREGFFAHVAPDGSDLRGRLQAAGASWRVVGENLGLGPGPLAAHFGIEHSPGHRHNLLSPQFTHTGIGIAFQEVDGHQQAYVTEVFSAPPQSAPTVSARSALEQAYEALASHRAALRLPPLKRTPALERIALEHARRALALDTPAPKVQGSNVHERVFSALEHVGRAAVDFYVLDDPGALPDSKSLADRLNTLVGAGLVRGDSPKYGPGRYWVVVIYATKR